MKHYYNLYMGALSIVDKDKLRRVYRQIRDNANRTGKDLSALSKLISLDVYLKANEIFSYVSFGTEADTYGAISDAYSKGKRIALPRIVDKLKMEFIWVENMCNLEPNKMGILEPTNGDIAKPCNGTVFIVPGLVFSETMNRIGYGGGFYDAYLKGRNVVKIGLCYEFQMVKNLPHQPHDVRMDYIVTDETVYKVIDID